MTQVTAKLIFKLPFTLKMQDVDYANPLPLKRGSEEIVIYLPIYTPNLVHKKLWELNTKKPRKSELDKLNCIVIDIRRDFSTIPPTEREQNELVEKGRDILHNLLTLCRWRGKQLYISVIDVENFDYRLRLFDADGNVIDATGMTHLTLPSLPLKSSDWNNIGQDLISGTMPELYEILLMDARRVVLREPHRAVLDAATAREVYIKRFYKSRKKRESVLNSLKSNKPELLEELDCLRKTNNSVKHKGKCQYRDDKTGETIKVDSTRASSFINAVVEAIQYTKSLGY